MKSQTELKKLGCQVVTTGKTGLKVFACDGSVTVLHLTATGMAVGSVTLNKKNALKLSQLIKEAAAELETV
jgi:hypothetical protein